MDLDTIRALFRYNSWANDQVFRAVSGARQDAFTRDIPPGEFSIRGTLTHIVWSEWIWLERWLGRTDLVFQPADFAHVPPALVFSPEDFPDVDRLRERWRGIDRDLSAFTRDLTPDRLMEVQAYRTVGGGSWSRPLWRLLCHAVNHSSYHRGQIAMMLRQFGHTPLPTDFVVFEG